MKMRKRKYIDTESYNWIYDKKIHGTLILFVSIFFIVFSFLDVRLLSSINSYTIGMIFGFYSILFYLYVLYIGLEMILGDRLQKPYFIKFTKKTYWILVLIIIFLSASTGFYQSKNGFTSIGAEPWKTFNSWFDTFTNKGISDSSAWFPGRTNGGLLGAFIYSLTASIFSGIGALIISILLLVVFVSIIFTGSSIEFYKNILLKKKFGLQNKIIKSDKNKKLENLAVQEDNKPEENIEKDNIEKEINQEKPNIEKEINQEKPNIEKKLEQEKATKDNEISKDKEDIKNNLPFDDPFNI